MVNEKRKTLYIDSREDKFIKMFVEKVALDQKIFDNVVVKKLECGDYESECCIVERKSFMDLASSITKKHRLDSQIARMLETNKFCVLLINGHPNEYLNVPLKQIYGYIASLFVREEVAVMWFESLNDAIYTMLRVMEKADEGKVGLTKSRKFVRKDLLFKKLLDIPQTVDLGKYTYEDVMTMSESELMKIKGIGKTTAKNIIKTRKQKIRR